jgi:hypothetical protein
MGFRLTAPASLTHHNRREVQLKSLAHARLDATIGHAANALTGLPQSHTPGPRPRRCFAQAPPPGRHPGGASSNPLNSNAGATTQLTNVHAPRLFAACQHPAGTTPCSTAPDARSGPNACAVSPTPSTD